MQKRVAKYTKAYEAREITANEYNGLLEALAKIMAGN
jgi:hypothetical protein